ncbi:GntR family transcriptional regulator [Mycolicibacterium mageritense]|uniref:HTH-type transcriptional repressor RspR n=1 Tax=Mycolicibacterium mageritense TaxID=53462 RepID=A0AAI8TPS2_MYCME|nr:GntR family transcriptional regulator [Mycolicibacterium mageritense]BDY26699.1 HTH-type transcriptional repressor RspR [Mycolicibacterium mageritense]
MVVPTLPGAPLNKQDWAYHQIRQWILSGELKPGQRLDQDTLANMLSISRIPLRQALSRLFAQGFVDHRPNQSWVVSPVSLADARDVYAGREALEVLLTEMATPLIDDGALDEIAAILEAQQSALDKEDLDLARHHDREFHDRIYQVAGMQRTLQMQQQLRAMSDRYIAMYMSDIDRALAGIREHREILETLRAGDVEAAKRAVGAHVRGGIVVLEALLS